MGSEDGYYRAASPMNWISKINQLFRPARLTRWRMGFAFAVAVVADGLQIPGQAIPILPEIIDVIAMVLTTVALGFHLLLLPTFALEFIPLVDMMPTWTGCVIAVIALRKREQTPPPPPVLPEVSTSPSKPTNLRPELGPGQ